MHPTNFRETDNQYCKTTPHLL